MKQSLVLSSFFQQKFDRLLSNLPQGTLLYGVPGVGLKTIAVALGGKNCLLIQPLSKKEELDLMHGTISIETIRRLYDQLKGKSLTNRVVILDNADRMSHGAQNAFLKLLEEPNSSTKFILTSHRPNQLLPTIRSRVRSLSVPPATTSQIDDLIGQLNIKDSLTRQQLKFLADGRPAEVYRLAKDSKKLAELAVIIKDAQSFLSAKPYQRLVLVKGYSLNRTDAINFTEALLKLLTYSLYNKPQTALLTMLDRTLSVSANLANNANPKVQLLKLVV